jgi:hypothetical protein
LAGASPEVHGRCVGPTRLTTDLFIRNSAFRPPRRRLPDVTHVTHLTDVTLLSAALPSVSCVSCSRFLRAAFRRPPFARNRGYPSPRGAEACPKPAASVLLGTHLGASPAQLRYLSAPDPTHLAGLIPCLRASVR